MQDPNFSQLRVDGKSRQSSDADVEQGYYTEIGNKNDPIVTTGFLNTPINVPSSRDLYYVYDSILKFLIFRLCRYITLTVSFLSMFFPDENIRT